MDARYEGKAATILARVNNFFLRLRFGDGSVRVVAARQVAVLDRGKAALTVVKNEERAP